MGEERGKIVADMTVDRVRAERGADDPRPARPLRSDDVPGRSNRMLRHASRPEEEVAKETTPISRHWRLVAPVIATAVVLTALSTWSFPPFGCLTLLIGAVCFAALSNLLVSMGHWENATSVHRGALVALATGAPMFLFGLGMATWVEAGALPWQSAVTALLAVSAIAAVIHGGRRDVMCVVQLVCWAPVAIIDGSAGALAGLVAGIPITILVSRRQIEIDRVAQREAEERARIQKRAEDILRDFEDSGTGWFWETDTQGNLSYISMVVAEALGCARESLHGRPFVALFSNGEQSSNGERTLAFSFGTRSSFSELDVSVSTKNGERWWSITGRPVFDAGDRFIGFRGSGHDLTEKRHSQEQASRLALFDSLTGLANRFQMSQVLEKILGAKLEAQRHCAVLLLDLDRFKQVNDTLGHPAGDALLQQVAQRLTRAVENRGRVGRLGGDEFQVIVPSRLDVSELGQLAQRIIESLSQPYSIEGNRVLIGASVGIALAPDHGKNSEALIRNADLALYAAKDGGRGRYHVFADDLHLRAEERRQLEQDLRDAIAHGGLELYYQPIVNTATEKISGFEALMRWNHPVKGPLSPAKFVEVAEDTGLIAALGEWALRTACHDLSQWPDDVRVAVNVSPLQFVNPQLPAIITNAIARAGIAAERLELEITESVFLSDGADTDAMFAALKRIGVRLALDDFGTGYSSLGYLKKAPFDKIKIDQSFVRGATQPGSRNGAIIASITGLAQALGMDTTAEGVETLDELDLVRMHGCSHVQGYIYEKPLTAAAAAERLRTGLSVVARGPRAARSPRQTMFRKVVLEHNGQIYNGTIRNISITGALVEGLWNVPAGTTFTITISENTKVQATARWSEEGRMGVQFAAPLGRDLSGRIVPHAASGPDVEEKQLRIAR